MRGTLEIDFEGQSYTISYSVDKGMIHVRSTFDSKYAVVGASPPEVLARIVGRELLNDAKRRGLLTGCHRGAL
jgi:hypothetical protein